MAGVFDRSVQVFIESALSDAARSAALAAYAEQDVRMLIETGRAPPRFEVYVDGRRNADPRSVRPDGVLNYKFNMMGDIVMAALTELKRLSPYGPEKSPRNVSGAGHYRDNFYVGVNRRMIMEKHLKPALIPADAEIAIGNVQPYNRKVDTRRIGTTVISFRNGEPNLFDRTVRMLRRDYGGLIECKRVYTLTFDRQYILQNGEKAGRGVESPAIIIKPKGMIS